MEYPLYATKDEVASFVGKDVGLMPENVNKLIRNASDLITNMITVRIRERHTEALKLATCAQVEFMIDTEVERPEDAKQLQSYSAASVSVTYDNTLQGFKSPLCSAARAYLNKQALLYRGVRANTNHTGSSNASSEGAL